MTPHRAAGRGGNSDGLQKLASLTLCLMLHALGAHVPFYDVRLRRQDRIFVWKWHRPVIVVQSCRPGLLMFTEQLSLHCILHTASCGGAFNLIYYRVFAEDAGQVCTMKTENRLFSKKSRQVARHGGGGLSALEGARCRLVRRNQRLGRDGRRSARVQG